MRVNKANEGYCVALDKQTTFPPFYLPINRLLFYRRRQSERGTSRYCVSRFMSPFKIFLEHRHILLEEFRIKSMVQEGIVSRTNGLK